MNYINQHTHTIYSPDAYPDATIENYINEAKKLSQNGLMFTDHVDIDSPVPMFFHYSNYDQYFAQIKELQKTTSIPLYTGVEIGYQPKSRETINTFINTYPFDLVICSIHVADGLDFYYGDFFNNKTTEESIKRYFEVVLDTVENFNNYDIFGHIDYITRYIKEIDDYDFSQHQEIITKILKTIIKNNKGIELNTSKGYQQLFPTFKLLKLYKELGGTYLTIGSDAHTPSKLQQNFQYALRVAKQAGFDNVYIYQKRTPVAVSIDQLLIEEN
ncbi:MAG: histidinol-phosphatase HisJ family protein [Candidatus Izemoplasmataceae bacterium]